MGMTLKELLTKGEGTLTAGEAKTLASQCRMDVETLYTLLEERGIKILDDEADGDTSLDVEGIMAEVESAEANSDELGLGDENEDDPAEENPADLKAAMDELLDDPVKNYLKQIGQIPLLSAEQEVDLSKRIHAGAEAAHILQADRQKYGAPEYIKKNSARFSFEEDENSRSYTEDLDEDGNTKSSEDDEEKAAEEEAMEAVENGPLTEERRQAILADNHRMAAQALRVLAAASRPWPGGLPEDVSPRSLEQDLCFIGLAGMMDPVRPEVKDAIAQCRRAGIRPVMITGDHKDTAVAIARQLGILTDPSQALTGADLDALSDEELTQTVDRYSVYARVQPEHKVRIVTAWRRRGAVTAMTGDGVNDAPSIKSADIGVGMGITGTDVTKNVADMVLSDDNFATIVGAVAEGRRIYDNIRKAIAFLLASNMSEVLGVFTAALLGFTLLNPVHLLFINLITDCFPALALGLERPEPDIMDRPPRSAKDGVFSGGLGFDIAYQGVLITVITLISYLIGHCMEVGYFEMPRGVSPDGMTMAFLTMSMCEIFHSFNMRSQRRSVFTLRGHNRVLWAAMLGSLVLTTVVLEVPPIAAAFGFTPVGWAEYGIALALAVLVIPVVELVKFIQRRRAR